MQGSGDPEANRPDGAANRSYFVRDGNASRCVANDPPLSTESAQADDAYFMISSPSGRLAPRRAGGFSGKEELATANDPRA